MTDKIPHVMDNWSYYYGIACSRSDLSELKNYLSIHFNKPHIKIGSNQVATEVKKTIQTEKGPKIITETVYKTVDQLLKELAPE